MFYGRRAGRDDAPAGRYTSHVTATDGTVTATQAVAFEMNAFRVLPSRRTAGPRPIRHDPGDLRRSAQHDAAPVHHAAGQGDVVGPDAKTATLSYKATVTLKTGGSAGKVTSRSSATDTGGHKQRTSLSLPLR